LTPIFSHAPDLLNHRPSNSDNLGQTIPDAATDGPDGETANMGERDAPMFCRLRRQNIGEMRGGRDAATGPGVEKPQATVMIAFGENAPAAAAKHRENVRGMWRGYGSWGRETPGYGNNRLQRKRAGGAGREGAVTNSHSTLRVDFGRKIHDSESRATIGGPW